MVSRSETWWGESRLYTGPGPAGSSGRYFVVYERDGRAEGYAFYRLRNKWESGTPQGAVLVVEALGETATATRELWRYLFGIDLTERVEADVVDPAAGLFLSVVDPRRLRPGRMHDPAGHGEVRDLGRPGKDPRGLRGRDAHAGDVHAHELPRRHEHVPGLGDDDRASAVAAGR
jgi:hypothetical protein